MSSAWYLSNMLKSYNVDIAAISEHTLYEHNLSFLDSIDKNYVGFQFSRAETVSQYDRRRCGKGGVAILVRTSLLYNVKPLGDFGERIVGIECSLQNRAPVFIFSVYMPSDNVISNFHETIESLQDIWVHYSQLGTVIMAGDFNARFDAHPISSVAQQKTRAFTEFVKGNDISLVNLCSKCRGPSFTFVPTRSTLDYILVPSSFDDCIVQSKVICNADLEIASDHYPVFCTARIPITRQPTPVSTPMPAWNKATIDMLISYQLEVHHMLSALPPTKLATYCDIDKFYDTVSHCLTMAASKSIPPRSYNPHVKPHWTQEVKEAHKTARACRHTWIDHGKPRGMHHHAYREYKAAKRKFRSIYDTAIETHTDNVYREIDEAAECDYRLFWKLVNKQKNRSNTACHELTVNDITYRNPVDISNVFANYFEEIYTPSHAPNTIYNRFIPPPNDSAENSNSELDIVFSLQEIESSVRTLPLNKAPGLDRVQNEHLRYGGRTLLLTIVKLFNAILQAGHIPEQWRSGLIVPIHKGGGKSRSNPDNYRPITLQSATCKLFEKIIHTRIQSWLPELDTPFPHPQQQGFQKQIGCLTASFNLQETVFANIEQNSKVYSAFLDTRKAFDTVWHEGLFTKLYNLGITGKIHTVIADSYTKLSSAVVVNSTRSKCFPVSRGVRQGGVLSTFLYLVYINDLIKELDESSLGATVGSTSSGSPALADDIALLATTPLCLQGMLNIAQSYADTWKFQYNADKCRILIFQNSRNTSTTCKTREQWTIGNIHIPQSSTYKHVGLTLSANLKHTECIRSGCAKGRGAFYSLVGYGVKPLGLNPLSSVSLYSKIVIPTALYGCELWSSMTNSDSRLLDTFQHKCCKNIQGLSTRTRSDICESMLGLHNLTTMVDIRKLFFLRTLCSLPERCVSKQIFLRRLYSFLTDDDISRKQLGFIPDIYRILVKYDLLTVLHTFISDKIFMTKSQWKSLVKRSVYSAANTARQKRMLCDTDFDRFRSIHGTTGPATIWTIPSTTAEFKRMDYSARLLSCVPQTDVKMCEFCNSDYADITCHVVASCTKTMQIRDSFWLLVTNTFDLPFVAELNAYDDEIFLQILLGKTPQFEMDPLSYKAFLIGAARFIKLAAATYYT